LGYYPGETRLVKPYIFSTTAIGDLTVVASTDPALSMIVDQINEKAASMNRHMKLHDKQTFKSNTSHTTCRIVLPIEVPIRAFAQTFINTPVQIQVGEKQVRLFVRPVTYKPPKPGQDTRTPEQQQRQQRQQQINDLGAEIDIEIEKLTGVSMKPSKKVPTRISATPAFDFDNPTTDKFNIIGYFIDTANRYQQYYIKESDVQKILEKLPESLRSKIDWQKGITLSPKEGNHIQAKVTFLTPLSIRETLDNVNTSKNPLRVSFTDSESSPLTVYLFMIPMTFIIKSDTIPELIPQYTRISEMAKQELTKIKGIMIGHAQRQAPTRGR